MGTCTQAFFKAKFPPSIQRDKNLEALLTHQEYAGDPTNNAVPRYVGDHCHDTSNDDWYIAHGLVAADWKIFAT